jgi:WD40 repeat protein
MTGDSQGYVNIFDISNYATSEKDSVRGETRPHVVNAWRAHVQGISALAFVSGLAVLTASADGSVRVWSQNGDYVGTFGGSDSQWLLSLPTMMSADEGRRRAETNLVRRCEKKEKEIV